MEVPPELKLEDILHENFGEDMPEGHYPSADLSALAHDDIEDEDAFELPDDLSDAAARAEFPDSQLQREKQKKHARRKYKLNIPEVPNEVLLLLAGMALSAVSASVAVWLGLEDTAWKVMMTLSLAVGLAPMLLESVGFLKDRSHVPAPLLMVLCCVISAVSGGVVEAVITAIIFNLLYAVIEAFTEHELHIVYDRLESGLEDLGEAERTRVSDQLREIDSRRIRQVVLERKIDKLLVLVVLGVGVFVSLIPPLFDGMSFGKWIGRAAAMLAVCLYTGETAILMSYLNAMDSCASEGIYFSGTASMSAAAELTSVLFSKSGTLTDGKYRITGTDPVRISDEQLIYLAAYAVAWSDHPLAKAVKSYAGFVPDKSRVERHQERPGYGSLVQLDGDQIIVAGNIDLMEELGVKGDMYIPGETCMFVAVGKTCVGRIDFADGLREDAAEAVNELRWQRTANIALMTGDNALNATNVGKRLAITEVYSDCRPKDKLSRLQYILDTQERDDRLAFVSSDSADRELLEMANLSVMMGESGDVTGLFPDILISPARLSKLPLAIGISKAVRRNNRISLLVSAVVRLAAAVLAATGILSLWSTVTIVLLMEAGLFFNTRVPDER